MSLPESPPEPYGRPNRGALVTQGWSKAADKRPTSRNIGVLTRLLPYILSKPLDLAAALFFLALAAAATLGLTFVMRLLVDRGLSSGVAHDIDLYFLLLGGVALIMAVSSAVRFFYVTKIGERVVADLRRDVYAHLLTLSPSFFHGARGGEAISRLTTDAAQIENLVGSAASIALRNLVVVAATLVLLVVISPLLAGFLLLLIPGILIPLFAMGGRVRKLSTVSQDKIAAAASQATETLDAIETVQAFGREDYARNAFSRAIDATFEAARRRIRMRAWLTAFMISFIFCGISGVLWFGAHQVLHNAMTPGALTQFVFLSIVAASGMAALAEVWGDVMRATGATERLMEILATPPDIVSPAAPVPIVLPQSGSGPIIRFQRLSFHYPQAQGLTALRELSFEIEPGELVALVGPSGAGKSTIFKLLLRFYDPDEGQIFLGNTEARQADPKVWRRHFASVSQDASLFTGSARSNIQFGNLSADEEAILTAAKRAEAWPFIDAREQKLDSPLGERARGLSGGERQRLVIARALVRDAPILLLDEATSALDAENERLVQKALEEARKGRTTLVIAHRLATVKQADRILVLDGGRLVETGTHTSLIAQEGLYAHLAKLQFAADPDEGPAGRKDQALQPSI